MRFNNLQNFFYDLKFNWTKVNLTIFIIIVIDNTYKYYDFYLKLLLYHNYNVSKEINLYIPIIKEYWYIIKEIIFSIKFIWKPNKKTLVVLVF